MIAEKFIDNERLRGEAASQLWQAYGMLGRAIPADWNAIDSVQIDAARSYLEAMSKALDAIAITLPLPVERLGIPVVTSREAMARAIRRGRDK